MLSFATAGNAFLGGYVAGLHLSDGDPYEGERCSAYWRVSQAHNR